MFWSFVSNLFISRIFHHNYFYINNNILISVVNSASVPTGDRRPQNQRNAAAAQSLRRQVGIKSTSNLRLHERVQPVNRRANEAPDGGMMASTPGGKLLNLKKFREIDFNIKFFRQINFRCCNSQLSQTDLGLVKKAF